MAILDIIILIVFVVAAVLGFRKGFIMQIGSIGALVIAIVVCRLFGGEVASLITPSSPEQEDPNALPHYLYTIVAYGVIYIVAYYAVILVTKLLKLVFHAVFLGPLDRIGGAIVSVVKWFIPVSLVLNLYIAIFPDSNLTEKSDLAGGKPVEWIVELAPKVLGAFKSCF